MRLPGARYSDGIGKVTQIRFGGLDRRDGAKDGTICDMQNLTSDHYPVLAVREKRSGVGRLGLPQGFCAWGKLAWVDDGVFYFDGIAKGYGLSAGQKRFAAIGSKIIILPDKCYYDYKADVFGSLEAKWMGASLHFENGEIYEEEAAANTIRAEGVDWSKLFREGDAVTVSGCQVCPGNNKTAIIREIRGDVLRFYENTWDFPEGEGYQETGQVTIARTLPDLRYLCENENRLWGCDEDTIYCSKLGDPFNWNVYDGLSSDSWALTPGSPGSFTGCCSYKGYAVFFKEDRIYKIYGSAPSNFSATGTASLGLIDGDSLAVAGETLYYLGVNGIMSYAGGIPQLISEELGTTKYIRGTAGSDGLKYYISLQKEDLSREMLVYDTQRNLWHREDEMPVMNFARLDGELYFLVENGEVRCVGRSLARHDAELEESEVAWVAEFGDLTEENANKKGLVRLQLRMELETGSDAAVLIQYDGDGIWHPLQRFMGENPKRSYVIPLIPRRCDHYRIRLEGRGGCKIYSMAREYYVGSDFRSGNGRN